MTTHAIIKQKFQEEVERLGARTSELREVGQKLLESYQESLALPSSMFVDNQGRPRNYVSAGFINDNGLFQAKNLSSMDLNHDLRLCFVISTVIDESGNESIAYAEKTISIYKEANSYYFDVGNNHLSIRVFQPDAIDAFHEVNAAIKESIISDITDPRLAW